MTSFMAVPFAELDARNLFSIPLHLPSLFRLYGAGPLKLGSKFQESVRIE
jgi:hypothetical protein